MEQSVSSDVVKEEHGNVVPPNIFWENAVPTNDIRTRGNGDTVAFPQVGLQKKCKVYGNLILRKVIETVATRCHVLKLQCTKFDFGWGSIPDPAGGAYNSPHPRSWIKGSLLVREGRSA